VKRDDKAEVWRKEDRDKPVHLIKVSLKTDIAYWQTSFADKDFVFCIPFCVSTFVNSSSNKAHGYLLYICVTDKAVNSKKGTVGNSLKL